MDMDGVKECVCNVTGLDIESVSDRDLLSRIGIDSLKFVELVLAIEEKFGFEIASSDLDLGSLKTIGDLVSLVASYQVAGR